ncbi:MAG: transcription elongation factor Spt5 [Acidilobaceae archaeon]
MAGQSTGASQQRLFFYSIQVLGGMEERVALILAERVKAMGLDVKSISVPTDLKGYVIIEVGDPGVLQALLKGARYVKARKPIVLKPEEAIRFLLPKIKVAEFEKGQIVEITGGPWKGMKGRIMEVYKTRNEAEVALLETSFRLVVTIPLDLIKASEEK